MIEIKLYDGLNVKELKLLGSGTQGKVYRIDSQKCIKIFKKKSVCRAELETLTMGQIDKHFPTLYTYGKNYIIRECVNGMELDRYLKANPLTPNISNKILELYDAMKKVGYNRLDTTLFHIFINEQGELKIIDTAKAMKKKTICPYSLIKGLEKLGYKKSFLNFVRTSRPDLYNTWVKYSKNINVKIGEWYVQ